MSPAEKKCYCGFDMAKNVNIKLSGDEFFMMPISKIMVPLKSPGFLLYVVKFAIVFVTHMEHLRVCQLDMLHFTVFCSTSNEIKKTLIGSDE